MAAFFGMPHFLDGAFLLPSELWHAQQLGQFTRSFPICGCLLIPLSCTFTNILLTLVVCSQW